MTNQPQPAPTSGNCASTYTFYTSTNGTSFAAQPTIQEPSVVAPTTTFYFEYTGSEIADALTDKIGALEDSVTLTDEPDGATLDLLFPDPEEQRRALEGLRVRATRLRDQIDLLEVERSAFSHAGDTVFTLTLNDVRRFGL
jgi:hypothetical protein